MQVRPHSTPNKSLDRRPRSEFLIVPPVLGAAPVNSVVRPLRGRRGVSLFGLPIQTYSQSPLPLFTPSLMLVLALLPLASALLVATTLLASTLAALIQPRTDCLLWLIKPQHKTMLLLADRCLPVVAVVSRGVSVMRHKQQQQQR